MTEWGRQWEKLVNLMRDEAIEIQNVGGEGYYLVSPTKLADRLLANGVTVQEWIPVMERLPKDDSPVLVYKSRHSEAYGNMETAYYYNQRRWIGCIGENVTHWMPLPEPPKMEGNSNE